MDRPPQRRFSFAEEGFAEILKKKILSENQFSNITKPNFKVSSDNNFYINQ